MKKSKRLLLYKIAEIEIPAKNLKSLYVYYIKSTEEKARIRGFPFILEEFVFLGSSNRKSPKFYKDCIIFRRVINKFFKRKEEKKKNIILLFLVITEILLEA